MKLYIQVEFYIHFPISKIRMNRFFDLVVLKSNFKVETKTNIIIKGIKGEKNLNRLILYVLYGYRWKAFNTIINKL